MKKIFNADNVRTAFAVYSNTDLTEGRGSVYPMHICETEATSTRLSKGYGPISLMQPTVEDRIEQDRIDDEKEAKRKKEAAIERAKSLGLSDEELEALKA